MGEGWSVGLRQKTWRGGGGFRNSREPVTLEQTRSTEARDVVGPVTIPFVQVILPAGSTPRGVETNAAGVVSGRRRGGGWLAENRPRQGALSSSEKGRRGRFAWWNGTHVGLTSSSINGTLDVTRYANFETPIRNCYPRCVLPNYLTPTSLWTPSLMDARARAPAPPLPSLAFHLPIALHNCPLWNREISCGLHATIPVVKILSTFLEGELAFCTNVRGPENIRIGNFPVSSDSGWDGSISLRTCCQMSIFTSSFYTVSHYCSFSLDKWNFLLILWTNLLVF